MYNYIYIYVYIVFCLYILLHVHSYGIAVSIIYIYTWHVMLNTCIKGDTISHVLLYMFKSHLHLDQALFGLLSVVRFEVQTTCHEQ